MRAVSMKMCECMCVLFENMCELHPLSTPTTKRGDNIFRFVFVIGMSSVYDDIFHVDMFSLDKTREKEKREREREKKSTTQQFPHHDVSMKIYTISSRISSAPSFTFFHFPFSQHKVILVPINVSQINRMR